MELLTVSVNNLHPSLNLLREFNPENPEFLDMLASVKQNGILQPIRIRPLTDEAYEEDYEIVFGHNRWHAAVECGMDTIQALLVQDCDLDTQVNQIIENTTNVKQNPVEVRNMILKIMASNEKYDDVNEIAKLISKSVSKVRDLLSLTKLANEQIEQLISNGTISATNAYKLAKLDPVDQEQYVQQASIMSTVEFAELVETRLKEVRDAKRAGGKAAAPTFEAKPRFRKLPELTSILDAVDVSDEFKAGVAYAISLDEATISEGKAQFDARQEAINAKRAEKDAEREAKKRAALEKRAAAKKEKADALAAEAAAILADEETETETAE